MSREKTQQAIADINRISGTAKEHLEKEEWLDLAGMFNHIETAAHRGFNLAYKLNFPEQQEEVTVFGPITIPDLQGQRLETLNESLKIQYAAPRPTRSPTRPESCTDECRHDNGSPKSFIVEPANGAHTRISFPEDHPDKWDVEKWYEDGRHTGKVNEFNMVRFLSGCLYRPCTSCEEDTGKACTCGYRDKS